MFRYFSHGHEIISPLSDCDQSSGESAITQQLLQFQCPAGMDEGNQCEAATSQD